MMIEYKVKVYSDGRREWSLNGKRHREDGPAVEYANGCRAWYLNGQLHREDGPAIERANGDREWWLNGYYKLTKAQFNERMNLCTGKVVEIDGKRYRLQEI